MKKLLLIALGAATTLTACNGGLTSSTPAATTQTATRVLANPSDEQKIGQYVWVSKKVTVKGITKIEVDCPSGFAVLGGGYQGNADRIDESYPDGTLVSWIVFAYDKNGSPETVYASCAPAK